MSRIALALALLLPAAAGEVRVSKEPSTRVYVRTIPRGATVVLDGTPLGRSDGLFLVPPGVRKVTIEMEGCDPEVRKIDVREGWITRVEVTLKKTAAVPDRAAAPGKPGAAGGHSVLDERRMALAYVDNSAEGKRSFADTGHAVAFERPSGARSVVAVELFGARYGHPKPPDEDFHVYLLDGEKKVIRDVPVPYAKIERGEMKWHTIEIPPTEIPEKFYVAVYFNAEATKGVYVGMDQDVKESHSYAGHPEEGFARVSEKFDWMIRAVLSAKPQNPFALEGEP